MLVTINQVLLKYNFRYIERTILFLVSLRFSKNKRHAGNSRSKATRSHRLQADNRRAEGVDVRQDVLTLMTPFTER